MNFTYIKIESIQEEFKLSDEFFLKDKLIEFCIGLRKRILDIDVDLYSCECDETSEKLKTEKKEYIDFEKNIILLAKKKFSDSIFNEYLKRRSKNEPIAYILEEKEFWSKKFIVNQDTLIPRPETELLVDKLLEQYKNKKIISLFDNLD